MRILLAFCILTTFTVAGIPHSGRAHTQVITVDVTHTHSHDDEHHEQDQAQEDEAEDEGHQDTHSHTVVVASATAVTVPQKIVLSFQLDIESTLNPSNEKNPPADPHLNSIFRPPIQA